MRTIVVGDLHGDHRNCYHLLRREGVIDPNGEREPGWRVVQVGDLIHGGHHEHERDLIMTKKLGWFDVVLVGNHEAPHVWPEAGFERFAGMTPVPTRVTHVLRGCKAASVVGDHLVTHAGLQPLLAVQLGVPASARGAAAFLNERWRQRTRTTRHDPLFDWIGRRRGGDNADGGVLWNDWRDLAWSADWPVKQIVGHTPRPTLFEQDPTGHLWCVDAGAALSGSVAALIVDDDGVRGVSYTGR